MKKEIACGIKVVCIIIYNLQGLGALKAVAKSVISALPENPCVVLVELEELEPWSDQLQQCCFQLQHARTLAQKLT